MELAPMSCSQMLLVLFFFFYLVGSEPEGNSRQWYMTSDVKEITGKSYDYIVVGGGTCGCPLAATLSHKFSVLLVERGSSPNGNPLVLDRNKYGVALLQTDKYASVAQSFISEDGVLNFRGRVLGGSSAINGGIYSRASEEYIEKAGWDKELVKDAYKWVESRVVFNTVPSPWQSVAEFSLLEAGILPYNGFSLNHIQGTKISGSVFDESGRRHTSIDLLETANPRNITVLLNATVESIIFHKNVHSNVPRARGINFIRSNGNLNEKYEAYLKQPEDSSSWGDVILAAGALGSPQILMLSGIGPKQLLRKFAIPVVLNLEGVGQGMQDNPSIVVYVDREPGKQLPDPPHVVGITDGFKIIVEAAIVPMSFNSTRVNIAGKLAFPKSRGNLKLLNKDPRLNPAVKFNYFSEESDLEECVKLTQLLDQVSSSKCIPLFLGEERQNKLITIENDPKKLCKTNFTTYYHYHGGCNVGSVVDKDYRVYGVQGLSVLDGSTFTDSPGTNPMATLLMLGRYQGIKILRERKAIHDPELHNIP